MLFLKKLILSVVIIGFWAPSASACIHNYYSKKEKSIQADKQEDIVFYKNGIETWIIQPAFKGRATDFGMLLPFETKPEIIEAPDTILRDLKFQLQDFAGAIRAIPAVGDVSTGFEFKMPVKVIEQKEVGDFDVTIIEAYDTSELIKWLKNNKYSYDEKADIENFSYYLEDGEHFFVAIKVNNTAAKANPNAETKGKLSPLAISFATEQPYIPFRIGKKEDMGPAQFELYAVADQQMYVQGSKLSTIKITKDISNPMNIQTDGMWLTKNTISFDPARIEKDIYLTIDANRTSIDRNFKGPGDLDAKSGLVSELEFASLKENWNAWQLKLRIIKVVSISLSLIALVVGLQFGLKVQR